MPAWPSRISRSQRVSSGRRARHVLDSEAFQTLRVALVTLFPARIASRVPPKRLEEQVIPPIPDGASAVQLFG